MYVKDRLIVRMLRNVWEEVTVWLERAGLRIQVYNRLDIQIAELWTRLGGLPSPMEAAGIWKDIWTAKRTSINGARRQYSRHSRGRAAAR